MSRFNARAKNLAAKQGIASFFILLLTAPGRTFEPLLNGGYDYGIRNRALLQVTTGTKVCVSWWVLQHLHRLSPVEHTQHTVPNTAGTEFEVVHTYVRRYHRARI